MSEVVYVPKSRILRKRGPLRIAHLPGEPQPVVYSVHGAIAAHYKVDPAKRASHSSEAEPPKNSGKRSDINPGL